MTLGIALADVDRMRAAVGRQLGLAFDDTKLSLLEQLLRRRVAAGDGDLEGYLHRLESRSWDEELGALAPDLTVGETYFFRHLEQFRAFAERALPEGLRSGARSLRVLSAGCATGEEAYSLAIMAREAVADAAASVSIRGVDVNPGALSRAVRGRYPAWSLRATPPAAQRRWFRSEGRDFVVDEAIRAAVVFERRNLAVADPELWPEAAYDVVFCRNVLMYMTLESGRALVCRIARALGPGAFLFLGHAETLRGLSNAFHLCHTHGTFYYQRLQGVASPPPAAAVPSPRPAVPAAELWVETIRHAAERIESLAGAKAAPPAPASAGSGADPGSWDPGIALELLRRERFGDALALVQALPAEAGRDPDVLLLHAVLLAHRGLLAEAEIVARALLAQDELDAGGHYVLALCREGAADNRGAVEHDRVAVYLDPGFAMPRLHLGLLARRDGDRVAACRELTRALELLEREDASRLLLFGGGFGREALVAICRAELAACGGAE